MNREKQRHHNVLSTKANNGELVKQQGLQGENVLALSETAAAKETTAAARERTVSAI